MTQIAAPLVWTIDPRNAWKKGFAHSGSFHAQREDSGWLYNRRLFPTLEAAFAAANADNESRLRAAIDPAFMARMERMEAALRLADEVLHDDAGGGWAELQAFKAARIAVRAALEPKDTPHD